MITQEYLKTIYTYREGNLYHKDEVKKCRVNRDGYHIINIKHNAYSLARIIYIYHYGDIPENLYIDHIDGDRQNNKIENLRLVTPLQNAWNRKCHREGKLLGANRLGNQWSAGITLTVHIDLGCERAPELSHDNYLYVRKLIAQGIKDEYILLKRLTKYKARRDEEKIIKKYSIK